MSKRVFTFKKEPRETGLAGVGHPWPNVVIKHQKKPCGMIYAQSWSQRGWEVQFQVTGNDDNPNCDWHWVRVANAFDSEADARTWIEEHANEIVAMGLYLDEDWNRLLNSGQRR